MRYQKYVVLTQGRTGSTIVTRMLARHPSVVDFNEVFNTNFDPENRPDAPRGEALRSWLGQVDAAKVVSWPRLDAPHTIGAERVLDQHVWSDRYAAQIRAVDFKVLWFQMRRDGPFPCLRERLAERLGGAKAIFVHRENLLRLYLSQETAKAVNQWHIFSEAQRRPRPALTISPDVLQRELAACRETDNKLLDLAGRAQDLYHVSYEELVANRPLHWDRIQHFLGLPREPIPQLDLVKIENRRLRQAIANYDELKQSCANTRWALCFDEK